MRFGKRFVAERENCEGSGHGNGGGQWGRAEGEVFEDIVKRRGRARSHNTFKSLRGCVALAPFWESKEMSSPNCKVRIYLELLTGPEFGFWQSEFVGSFNPNPSRI